MASYVVKSGDTLGAIATQLGIADWQELYVNGMLAGETDPRKLAVGSTITTTAPGAVDPDEPITQTEEEARSALEGARQHGAGDTGIVDSTPGEVSFAVDGGAVGILAGGGLARVSRPGRDDLYIQVYSIPGTSNFAYYQFDPNDSDGNGTPDEIEAAFGADLPSVMVLSEVEFEARDNTNLLFAGAVTDSVLGVQGNFNQLYDDVQRQALSAAGITDPGLQGQILANPEIQGIISTAALTGTDVSAPQVVAQIRASDFYQNELYPGIKFFLDRGDSDPAQAWRNYQAQTESVFRQLGIQRDEDGTYRNTIGEYLTAGIDADELATFAPVLVQIQENPDLKGIMDQWAMTELGRTLDFNEFVDVLEGTTDPELNQVVEAATLAHAAERAGLHVSVADIRSIAAATDLSPFEALNAFNEAERSILAAGATNLQTFGVSQGDFLDIAAGIAPRSGLSSAAVQNIATKVATEQGLVDDPSARFFTRLNDAGRFAEDANRDAPRG